MYVITSDWHLTANPRDEYRWALFDYLLATFPREDKLLILGDLTDAKDRHPASLVNRVAHNMKELARHFESVVVLRGNHDCTDPNNPFFNFFNWYADNLYMYSKPTFDSGDEIMYLPHERDPVSAWNEEVWGMVNGARYVMLHQTFDGAKASNGTQLEGISPKLFSETEAKCFSGDIHVPQRIGPITYVGSPYHVHFGDKFIPRIIRITHDGEQQQYFFKTIKKLSLTINNVEDLEKQKLKPNDQVKLRVRMNRSEFVSWTDKRDQIAAWCEDNGVVLCGLEVEEKTRKRITTKQKREEVQTPKKTFEEYCKREGVEKEIQQVGARYL